MAVASLLTSESERSEVALRDLLAQAEQEPNDGPRAGVLLASEHHRAQAEYLRSSLVRAMNIEMMTGTVTRAGFIRNRGYFDRPFLTLLSWPLNQTEYPSALQISRLGDERGIEEFSSAFVISSSTSAAHVLNIAQNREIFMMGAITFAAEPTIQFHRDGTLISGASGLGWRHEHSIAATMVPSAEVIGDAHEITAAHEDIIIELDGRPALDVLCEALKIKPHEAFDSVGTQFLIGIEQTSHDVSHRIYRHIVAIDTNQKMFSVGHRFSVRDTLTIGSRTRDGAIRLLNAHCTKLKSRFAGRKPLALLFSGCIARGPAMFQDQNEEAELIAAHFPNLPILGMYGNGELFGDELQSYAAVLTVVMEA